VSRPNHDEPAETPVASLARHSLVYSIAPMLQRFIALALTRLYTNRLNESQYGVVGIADLLFTALVQISGTNLLAAVVRFYLDQKEERDRRAVVSSALIFLSFVSWTLVAIGFVFRAPLTHFLFDTADPWLAGDDLTLCLLVVLGTIPLALSSEAAFRYLQIQQRSGLITTLKVSKSTLEMGLKVLFLVGFNSGVIGFLLATLIGELITNLCLTSWVLSRVGLAFSWRVLTPMLRYSAPLVLVGLCQMALNQGDRLLLRQLGPENEAMGWVGIYSLGYQVGWLVQLVLVGSIMQIWQPWIFSVQDPQRRVELVRRVSTWALFAVGTASIGLMLFGRELVHVLSSPKHPEFLLAYSVVPWVCAGYAFFLLNGLSQVPMFIAKRTWPMLWLNLLAVAVNFGLNFALIPRLGFVGAAIATLATFMVLGVFGHILAGKLVGARFEHGRMGAMLALVLAIMAATLWIDHDLTRAHAGMFTPMTGVKAVLFLAALGLIWRVMLQPDERRQCVEKVRAKLGR